VEKKNDPNANDFSVKNNLSPPASRFSPRVENDLSLNQREEKERESGMWNGSHPPGRIIAGHCTYVHTYSRTHVTRVQGRHKWVGALTLARSRARARPTTLGDVYVYAPLRLSTWLCTHVTCPGSDLATVNTESDTVPSTSPSSGDPKESTTHCATSLKSERDSWRVGPIA